jgi:hypothetical protein
MSIPKIRAKWRRRVSARQSAKCRRFAAEFASMRTAPNPLRVVRIDATGWYHYGCAHGGPHATRPSNGGMTGALGFSRSRRKRRYRLNWGSTPSATLTSPSCGTTTEMETAVASVPPIGKGDITDIRVFRIGNGRQLRYARFCDMRERQTAAKNQRCPLFLLNANVCSSRPSNAA